MATFTGHPLHKSITNYCSCRLPPVTHSRFNSTAGSSVVDTRYNDESHTLHLEYANATTCQLTAGLFLHLDEHFPWCGRRSNGRFEMKLSHFSGICGLCMHPSSKSFPIMDCPMRKEERLDFTTYY
jgi:hypothetical protein